MITGETLRQLRLLKGLNKKEAARKLGTTPAAYSRLEQEGWLQGEMLQTILKELGCTTADVEKVMALLN
jgi:transcriptional regulator with XRE-family HTH domain